MAPASKKSKASLPQRVFSQGRRLASVIYGLVFCIFMLLPILVVVPVSFTSASIIEFPPKTYSTRWYEALMADGTWLPSMGVSAKIAVVAALISTVAGLLIGLSTFRFGPVKPATRTFFLMPLLVPHVALATGLFVALLQWRLLGSWVVLAIANAVLTLPITVVMFLGAFQAMDRNLWIAASSLGARYGQIMMKVILPLVVIPIVISFILSFEKAWDEVTLAVFIGPSITPPLPSAMYSEQLQQSTPIVGAVSAVLLAITMLCIIVVGILKRRAKAMSQMPVEEVA